MTAHGYEANTNWERALRVGFVAAALAAAITTGCGDTAKSSGNDAVGEDDVRSGSDDTGVVDAGSGGSDEVPPSRSSDAEPPPPSDTTPFDAGANVECTPITDGTMKLTVNGKSRTFLVQLPKDTSHMALLFLWHGWMQDPAKFANEIVYDVPAAKWVPFDPNAFPMPLMIVTPVDTKMIPPFGLDWDIVSGEKDFPYFEAMLQCITGQFPIEKTRIYSFGFSAGAVFTNLLSAKYPKLFAATIAESGMWYNDESQWSDVKFGFIMQWKWPPFDPADRGNVLLTHGGKDDYATVADLEAANKKAVPFLHDNGRTVVECSHTFGHTPDPDLTQSMYYDYMWSHTLGGPPLSALVPSFPTEAKPVGATSCKFHPAP